MDKRFCEYFYEKGIYNSPDNEIKRIDLLLDALECQKQIRNEEEEIIWECLILLNQSK